MSEDKRLYVVLKMFRGMATYNEHGQITSENSELTLQYNTLEWSNFIKRIRAIGYTKIVFLKTINANGETVTDFNDEIKKEVAGIFLAPEKELTPEQKEIKELKEQMAALVAGKKPDAEVENEPEKEENKPVVEVAETAEENKDESNDEVEATEEMLEAARAEYFSLFGEKPNYKTKYAKLKQQIADKLAE